MQKHKIASISLTDKAISSKFSTPKMQKHKNASISLIVGDRAISWKISTNRVSKQYTLPIKKKFCLKLVDFWKFEFLGKILKCNIHANP